MCFFLFNISFNTFQALQELSSSLIHLACIGVAPLDCGVKSREGATPMQAKWIKLDQATANNNCFHCNFSPQASTTLVSSKKK